MALWPSRLEVELYRYAVSESEKLEMELALQLRLRLDVMALAFNLWHTVACERSKRTADSTSCTNALSAFSYLSSSRAGAESL